MKHGKRRLGLVCLCVAAALSATVLSAAAQGASIKIAGKEVEIANLSPSVAGEDFDFSVPNLKLEVECSAITFDKPIWLIVDLPPPVPIWDPFVILWGICSALVNEKTTPCMVEPFETKAKGSAFLHSGKTFTRIEPQTGTTFAVVKFTGGGCALPEEITVSGKVVAQATTLEKEEVMQKLSPLPTGLFGDQLFFGKNAATLEASEGMGLTLDAPFEGQKWSITG